MSRGCLFCTLQWSWQNTTTLGVRITQWEWLKHKGVSMIPKDPQTAWELQKGNVFLTITCPALWHTFTDTKQLGNTGRRISQWVRDQSALFSEFWKDKLHNEAPKATDKEGEGENVEILCPAGKALSMEASDLSLDPQHWQKRLVWGWTRTCHLNSEVQGLAGKLQLVRMTLSPE